MWAAIGLFPNAGQDYYYLTPPEFARVEIRLEADRRFVIETTRPKARARYIQSATLNGMPLDRAWLRHAEIVAGGTLALNLSPKPSSWGSAQRPPSLPPDPGPSAPSTRPAR